MVSYDNSFIVSDKIINNSDQHPCSMSLYPLVSC